MLQSAKKRILGIGILKEPSGNDPSYSPERVKQEVQDELTKLREAGFEVTLYFADSKSIESAMPEVKRHLDSGPWDGVSIGYGLRGDTAYTPLFEEIVNAVVTETGREDGENVPKFMFTSSTGDIYDAAIRVLGN